MTTQELVNQALNNAIANGYEINLWTADRIVQDVKQYDAELEGMSQRVLKPLVSNWKRIYNARQTKVGDRIVTKRPKSELAKRARNNHPSSGD